MNNYFQNQTPAKMISIEPREGGMHINYSIVRCYGSCLDHPQSPLQLKNGDYILMYQLDTSSVSSWLDNIGKVVCIASKRYGLLVKILTFYSPWAIRAKMMNPEQEFYIPLNDIEALFTIDQVVPERIMNQA